MTNSQKSSPRIRELMEAICRVQQTRSEEWSRIKKEILSHLPKTRQANFDANHIAYSATRDKAQSLKGLLQTLFDDVLQLSDSAILEGDPSSLCRLVSFLLVDVPAFQCGYAKERYLQILKHAHLTQSQRLELQSVALFHCRSPHFRREFKALCRLMIHLADPAFVSSLIDLSSNPSASIRLKAQFMLKRIQNGRKDLRPTLDA